MLRLATFDLYNTLCHAEPSRPERVAALCAELGVACDVSALRRANVAAEELYTNENGRHALYLRSADEQQSFYQSMWSLLLREAGLAHDDGLVERLRAGLRRGEWVRSDDVLPTFDHLRRRGLAIGVISNTPIDATVLCEKLGLCDHVDFIVSSCLVGCEKPGAAIFQAALTRANVAPEAAVHVGDQPRSDALGATAVGMHALLLDRDNLLGGEREYERIRSLAEVPRWVDARSAQTTGMPGIASRTR